MERLTHHPTPHHQSRKKCGSWNPYKGKRGEKGGGGRNPLPPNLPRVEQVVDVPEEERTCPDCGMPFKRIGEERSEQLHFKPMELFVVVQILLKYVAACPAAFLKGYDKNVVCDANTVNHGLFVPEGTALPIVPVTEVGCWSHCRSNFVDAKRYGYDAEMMLKIIRGLYLVERRAKKMPVEERLALRKKESLPILNTIFDWCRENVTKYELQTDLMGKAIRYALNQESVLRVYCTDGRLPIDNNAAERILRLIAIGRKNWQFYGSANGGKTGAVLHSILASAHRHGLNEYEYLLDVINRLVDLPSQAAIADLLPDRWQPKLPR